MDDILFRWAGPADYAALGELMFDAVRKGPSPYDAAQRAAWMPEPRQGAAWDERLGGQEIVAAEADDRILGFMTLAEGGYVDFAYIRPAARGRGLFGRLYAQVEARARDRGLHRLWVHASLMAEPAFAAHGFSVVRRETVSIGGESLDRCEMEKILRSTIRRTT